MRTVAEVRKKYLEFFEKRGHAVIPSASLVPENDPTTLFTGSGMQPLVPYLLGESHPGGKRLVNSQKCFRSEDIEEVGDNRHTTFFEMLGNWSLGDYFKEEQLAWCFEFLTKELGIPREQLWVTCFAGDETLGLPRDNESAEIWEELGIPKERIRFYGAEKNWWSRSGAPEKMPAGEPGGPDSEVFFDFDADGKRQLHQNSQWKDEECHPNCDCGRFMEIGNSVFMEYRKVAPRTDLSGDSRSVLGTFEKLSQRNVDFGGGLERITAAVNDEPDVFRLDVFTEKIRAWEKESGKSYADEKHQKAFRVVADHTRAAEMLTADGVTPSNLGQGYVLRRLLRRAILFADRLGIILDERFREEEEKFRKTLERGLKEFNWRARTLKEGVVEKSELPPSVAFELFTTYGFPFELIVEEARARGLTVDKQQFQNRMEAHQIQSRAGIEREFRGGLADTSEMSVKYHTATHLLHQALRDVLGDEVRQKGSNITPERLRFDFAFPRKMTNEEKKRVEEIVNEKIQSDLPVHKVTLPLAEAKKSGALHFFDEKYPEQVLIHYIGESLESAYSKEFCGGPHVTNTGTLGGGFNILKEEAISAGVRRIKAILQ